MASTVAAETTDFARRFFGMVLELGREDWVSAHEAFERTLTAHPDHPYVAYLRGNRARRANFGATAERVRTQEFPQIERRKAGTRRNAPVFYRVGRASAAFSLHLPYDVPPSHPLRSAAENPRTNPLRREPGPQDAGSPWRRRQAVRRAVPDSSATPSSSAGWWQKLTGDAAAFFDRITRVASRRWR